MSAGSQQLLEKLHASAGVLHKSPGFVQLVSLLQRPSVSPGAFEQVSGLPGHVPSPTPLQQSLSFLQSSPFGAQPDGCWQIVCVPVESLKPHDPEQHPELQTVVSPALAVHVPSVTEPATVQLIPPPVPPFSHFPACVAVAPLHRPPQH